MQRLVTWFVDNPVASNLLMLILVVGGLIVLPGLQKEEFPDIEIDVISVTVPYLGAAPSEVESGVCVRVEEAVDSIEGINKITSRAAEGVCNVSLQLERNANRSKALDDITAQVNAITTFPANTERPIIAEATVKSMVMQLAISGRTDERSLKEIAENIRDELQEIPGISQVDPLYTRNYEISVEVSEHTLRQHGLTMKKIADAIRDSSLDVPGGTLRTRGGEILLRTKGQMYTGREFEQIPIIARSDGTMVTLGEIATVVDGFEIGDKSAVFDGYPSVLLSISRVGEQDALEIASKARAYVEGKRLTLPDGIDLTFWRDESADLLERLDALLNNAAGGLVLVIITLSLFLRTRLALWVSAGIPISVFGALAMFPAAGLTINTLSLMGFLLALGILVDDAIVVGERVYAHEKDADDLRTAAVRGTSEVSVPVFFGVLTTMAAFIPIVSIDTNMGDFFNSVGITVVVCLVFSLIESLLVLPCHLAHRKVRAGVKDELSRWEKLQDRLSDGLQNFATQT